MAIGTWQVTEAFDTSNTYIKYRIACLENSTSTSNNSSNVRITVNIWRTNQGYTTYGNGTAYVTINGTQYTQAITSSQAITYNDYNSNYFDKTLDIPHGTDGKKTLTVSAYISHDRFSSSSHSGSFAMTDIPRQTSITKFTVDKYSNTKLKVNWQTADNVNKVEYSTDNGSTFKTASTSTATSGNFVISQLSANTNALSPNTPYKCVLRVTRQDSGLPTTSSAVSQTTYKTPTTAVSSKTETSITMSWSIDSAANYIQYSIDNGSWVNVGTTTATSGAYTINNLNANSQHSIKTNVRRAASNEYETTNTASDTTYDWPYVTAVGSSTLTIGNSQTLTLYNPLKRNVTVKMLKDNTSGTQFYSGTTTGTSISFTPNSTTMLNSIPSSQNGKCVYNVYYTTNKTTSQYTYQINTSTIKPTFPNFAYKDIGTSALTTAIANNQVIVQGVSNVNLVISSANKLVPSTGASAATSSNSKYVATFDNLSKTQAYSDSDIDVNLGIPTGKGTKTFSVNAYDARNTYNTVPKSIEIIEYDQPVVTPSIERLNGFETSTTFNVTGTFSKVTVNNVDKNMISSVKYRYKESSSSTWGAWTSMTIQSQGNGQYTTTSITLDCDNEKQFDFQFEVIDLAKTVVVSRTLSVGQPLMFLHTNGDLDIQGNIMANNYKVISLTGGSGNTTGYRCFCAFNGTAWGNYRATMIVRSRHTGTGILSVGISFGADTDTLSGNPSFTYDGNITQFNGGDAWVMRREGAKVELWWKYSDYNDTTIIVTSSNINIVGGGTWQTSLPSTGTKYYACNSAYPIGAIYMSAINTSPATLFGGVWTQLKSRFIYATGNAEGSGSACGKDNVSTGTGTSTISQSTSTTGQSSGNTGASSGSTGGPSTNSTGGVTLTANQSGIKSHSHTFKQRVMFWDANTNKSDTQRNGSYTSAVQYQGWNDNFMNDTSSNAGASHSHTLSDHTHSLNNHTHSLNNHTHSYSHTHGISYVAVYMWQRTA